MAITAMGRGVKASSLALLAPAIRPIGLFCRQKTLRNCLVLALTWPS